MSWRHQRCLFSSTTILGKTPFSLLSNCLISNSSSQSFSVPQTPNLTTQNVQAFSVSFFLPYLLYSCHSSMDLVPFLASMNPFSLGVGRENQEANAGFSLVGGGKYKPGNTSQHIFIPSLIIFPPLDCETLYMGQELRDSSLQPLFPEVMGGGRRVGRHKYLFAFEPLFLRLCLSSRINFFFWW